MGRSGGGGSGGRSGGGRSGGGFSGGGRSSGGFSGGRSSGGSGGRSLFSGGGSGGSGSGGGSRNRGSGGFNIGPIVPIFINRERRRDSGAPRGTDSGYGYPPNGYPPTGSGAPYESTPNAGSGYGAPPYSAPPNTYPSSPYPGNAPSYAPPPVGAPSAGTGSTKKGCGCSTILLVLGLLIVLSSVVSLAFSCAGTKIDGTPIVERAPLAATAVVETGYYTDEDGDWVHSPSKLENGLREFYRQTGVQPYVYILPNGTTTSTQELGTLAEQRYDELFSDEGHFLLVFCDDGDGGFNCGYAVGSQARSVMDDAAIDVLADNLDKNYRNYSLDEEEIFSKAFADTAETIMKKDDTVYNAVVSLVTVLVIVLVYVAYRVVRTKKQEKERARQFQEELLRTPLEKFGDQDVEELSRKYEQAPVQTPPTAGGAPASAPSDTAEPPRQPGA